MPSNKPRIQAYLEPDEATALSKLCDENKISFSEGVSHLIRNHLIENDESEEVQEIEGSYEERLALVESEMEISTKVATQACRKNEQLEGLIAELQEEVCRLKEQLKNKPLEVVSDDQVAAATNQPEWKVKLWRHGAQKPKGARIKERLIPFEVVQGQWVKAR